MVEFATQVKRRRGTTAENDAFTGAEGEITVDLEKHELRLHDGQTQGGFVIGAGGSGSGRNIGDIFYTKRTDTGLAGAVECNGGTYNTEDYEGEGSIGELLEGGLLDYISLTDYATAISTKGYCDKIGWDGTGTTSFRVPTLTPKRYVVKVQEPTAGNNYTWYRLYNDGWVEQGGTVVYGAPSASFPITMQTVHYFASAQQADGNIAGTVWLSVTRNTTNMSIYYDRYNKNTTSVVWQVSGQSAIVSDQTERAMFQLFNSTTDEAVATVGTVVAQVGELNSHRVIDFQIPTAENGYTWYRKYADGWVEQGGIKEAGTTIINFPIAMANTDYWYIAKGNYNNTSGSYASSHDCVMTKNTTNMVLSTGGTSVCWQVSGISA